MSMQNLAFDLSCVLTGVLDPTVTDQVAGVWQKEDPAPVG